FFCCRSLYHCGYSALCLHARRASVRLRPRALSGGARVAEANRRATEPRADEFRSGAGGRGQITARRPSRPAIVVVRALRPVEKPARGGGRTHTLTIFPPPPAAALTKRYPKLTNSPLFFNGAAPFRGDLVTKDPDSRGHRPWQSCPAAPVSPRREKRTPH